MKTATKSQTWGEYFPLKPIIRLPVEFCGPHRIGGDIRAFVSPEMMVNAVLVLSTR